MVRWKTTVGRWAGLLACSALVAAAKPTTQTATVNPRAYEEKDNVDPQLAKLLESTPITLSVEKSQGLQALTQLGKASGYTIKPAFNGWFGGNNARGGNVTLSETAQPFWQVLRDICVRSNISLYPWGSGNNDERTINISPGNYNGGSMQAAASIQGPFLCNLSGVERENTVVMSDPAKVNRTIHIQLQSFAEPKVMITEASYQPTVDEAVDDNGNTMPQAPQGQATNMQSTRGIAWNGSIDLPYPTTNPGTHIAKLNGHSAAKAQVSVSSEPWVIDDPVNATETSKTIDGNALTFKSLKKEGKQFYLSLAVQMNAQINGDVFHQLSHLVRLHLIDAQGNEGAYFFNGMQNDGKVATVRYGFRPGMETPKKLTIEVQGAPKDLSVPFELVNVPMP